MTEANPPANPPADDKITTGTLREMIREELKNVAGTLFPVKSEPAKTESATNGPDVKSQVETALTALRKREERDARDAKIDKLLEQQAVKPVETAPVERRKVHKIMGWGE